MRSLILVSGVFLLLQVAVTDYGADRNAEVFWFVSGAVLLWLVYRKHSRVARGVMIVLALTGAVFYATVAVADGPAAAAGRSAALLALSYLGQALPLLTTPVRRYLTQT